MPILKTAANAARKVSQRQRYLDLIRAFRGVKIMIVGDFILDQFIWGTVERISPEAPVPVVHVREEQFRLGGALNVAHNIHTLFGNVVPCGVLGRDRDGRMLRRVIHREGIDTGGIIYEDARPTTVKTRVIAHSQQVVRFDREKTESISTEAQEGILKFVEDRIRGMDAVVIEDYGKGVIESALLKKLIKAARQVQKPVLVDPKEKHFSYYPGITTMTPNRKEAFAGAEALRIRHNGSLEALGKGLLKRLRCDSVLITLGEDGMALFENSGAMTHIPTAAREIFDVSGAGDTVISVLALALGAGAKTKEAAVLANLAAGIVVGKLGTATVSPDELSDAVKGVPESRLGL